MWRRASAILWASLLIVLNGCAAMGGDDPEELLSQAISSIVGQDDFEFEGKTSVQVSDARLEQDFTFTGVVSGHNEIYIEPDANNLIGASALYNSQGMLHYAKVNKEWTVDEGGADKQLNPLYTLNPLIHAEHLNRAAKDVRIDDSVSEEGMTVLHAAVEEDQLTDLFKRQIRQEHDEIIEAALAEARTAGNTRLAAELDQYAGQAEQRLEEILDSLSIQADYRLKVDRRSRQLHEMYYAAKLLYKLDGNNNEERIETSYRFPSR